MTPTNEKSFFDASAIAHAARAARARAFAEFIGAVAGGIKSLTNRFAAPLRARAQRQRQLEELLSMDDHMLRDLGLSRGGIAYAFAHGRDAEVGRAEFGVGEPANTNTPPRPFQKPHAA